MARVEGGVRLPRSARTRCGRLVDRSPELDHPRPARPRRSCHEWSICRPLARLRGRGSSDPARDRSNGRPSGGLLGHTSPTNRYTSGRPPLPARPVERVAHGGLSSIGRASDCGSEGYGFKPRRPPHQSERETAPSGPSGRGPSDPTTPATTPARPRQQRGSRSQCGTRPGASRVPVLRPVAGSHD
jgi:hypothetical protein